MQITQTSPDTSENLQLMMNNRTLVKKLVESLGIDTKNIIIYDLLDTLMWLELKINCLKTDIKEQERKEIMSNFWRIKDIVLEIQDKILCNEGKQLSSEIIDIFVCDIEYIYKNNPEIKSISNDDLISELKSRIKKET